MAEGDLETEVLHHDPFVLEDRLVFYKGVEELVRLQGPVIKPPQAPLCQGLFHGVSNDARSTLGSHICEDLVVGVAEGNCLTAARTLDKRIPEQHAGSVVRVREV